MVGMFIIKKASNGQFHFELKAGNGEIVLTSMPFSSKHDARNAIESIKRSAREDGLYDRRTSKRIQPYFVLRTQDSEILGISGMFSLVSSRESAIDSVRTMGSTATVLDLA